MLLGWLPTKACMRGCCSAVNTLPLKPCLPPGANLTGPSGSRCLGTAVFQSCTHSSCCFHVHKQLLGVGRARYNKHASHMQCLGNILCCLQVSFALLYRRILAAVEPALYSMVVICVTS